MGSFKMTERRLYAVEYWRNDGEWHSLEYDRSPTYTFYAKGDGEAERIALGYIAINKKGREDFSIMRLEELNIVRRKVKIELNHGTTFFLR